MANENGVAGKSTRALADSRYAKRVLFTLVGISAALALVHFIPSFTSKGAAGLVVFLIILRVVMDLTDRQTYRYERLERRASKGARAEEAVGGLLQRLPDDYAIFHDIESPYGNIDHVAINKRNQVFLIETKSHHGEVTYSGGLLLINEKKPEKDFIAQTLKNTYWLRDEIKRQTGLEIFIKPVIVFTNAFVKIRQPIKNVSVVNKKYLVKTVAEASGRCRTLSKEDPARPSLFVALKRLQGKSGGEKLA